MLVVLDGVINVSLQGEKGRVLIRLRMKSFSCVRREMYICSLPTAASQYSLVALPQRRSVNNNNDINDINVSLFSYGELPTDCCPLVVIVSLKYCLFRLIKRRHTDPIKCTYHIILYPQEPYRSYCFLAECAIFLVQRLISETIQLSLLKR